VSAELMANLLSYSWPGNVRELENCIRQMVVMSQDPLLTPRALPASIRHLLEVAEPQPAGATNSEQLNTLAHALSEAVLPLVEIERRAILRALDQSGGDCRVAAHLLGIGRTTLFRRLKAYGLRPRGGEPKP
jgi:DNA-binding NtrC family response regulator